MAVIRFKRGDGALQGYPAQGDNATSVLQDDVAAMERLYFNFKQTKDPDDNDITHLAVGRACSAIKDTVEADLRELLEELIELKPDDTVPSEIKLKMGPLKKLERVAQKAVGYATCDMTQSALPRLEKVADILRATMIFPPSYFRKPGIGSEVIDKIDEYFGGKVLSVKNRFVETRYPKLQEYDGRDPSASLQKDIEALINLSLRGRDTFYRDLQIMVRLDQADYPNGGPLTHVCLELQIVSSMLYGAKVTRSPNEESGHDMYKLTRAIMEHCEYKYYEKKVRILFDNAEAYFKAPVAADYAKFTPSLRSMWKLYRSVKEPYRGNLQSAIDDSTWYNTHA